MELHITKLILSRMPVVPMLRNSALYFRELLNPGDAFILPAQHSNFVVQNSVCLPSMPRDSDARGPLTKLWETLF